MTVSWSFEEGKLHLWRALTLLPGLFSFVAPLSAPLISVIHHFHHFLANRLLLCLFVFYLCQSRLITSREESHNPTSSVPINLWASAWVDPLRMALQPFCFPLLPLLKSKWYFRYSLLPAFSTASSSLEQRVAGPLTP